MVSKLRDKGLTQLLMDRGEKRLRRMTGYYWTAVCNEHFDEHYDEEDDGYSDTLEEGLICDHEGCERKADYEINKNLAKSLRGAEPCVKVEGEEGTVVMMDSFVGSLKELTETEEDE